MDSPFIINFQQDNTPWLEYIYVSNAAQVLNGVAFKLYIYLSAEIPNGSIKFSPAHFCKWFGGGPTSAKRSIEELIEKGFLCKDNNNQYTFFRQSTKMDYD